MANHAIVSSDEWLEARKQLFARESCVRSEISMDNECAACGDARAPAAKVRRSVRLARYESWLGFVAGLGALLAPKCPLCLTAYLSLCGVTFGLGAWNAVVVPARLDERADRSTLQLRAAARDDGVVRTHDGDPRGYRRSRALGTRLRPPADT